MPHEFLQKAAGPIPIRSERHLHLAGNRHRLGDRHLVRHRARRDDDDAGVGFAHRFGKQVVLDAVLVQRHMAELPMAVHFVADIPEFHAVRFRVSVGRAQSALRRRRGAVDIFHQFPAGSRLAKAGIHTPIRVDAHQFAHHQQLIDTGIVGLHGVPSIVKDRGTLVRIADRILPVVAGDKVAARKAKEAAIHLLHQRDRIGPEAVDVVRGHERNRANPERSRTGSDNLDAAIRRVGVGGEGERGLAPVLLRGNVDGLPVAGAFSPDQGRADLCAAVGGQDDLAGICLALYQR